MLTKDGRNTIIVANWSKENALYMSQSQDEQMLTIKQVAKRMNVDETTVRRWIQRGDLRAVNIGRVRPEYRIRPTDLEEFISNRETDKPDN